MKKIKVFLMNLAKKSTFIRKIFRSIKANFSEIKYSKYKRKYKTNDKMVFFEAFGGRKDAYYERV